MPESKKLARGHNVSAYLDATRAAQLETYMKKKTIKKPNQVVLRALDKLFEPLLDAEKKD